MRPYMITRIDWQSFPADCQPHISEAELPYQVFLGEAARDEYREDAATEGILAHSPYCPWCGK